MQPQLFENTTPKPIRGQWSILFVAFYLTLASLFFLFDLRRSLERVNHFLVALNVIRTGGAVLITILLWKYWNALRAYNRKGQTSLSGFEGSHALLWRLGAVCLAIHLVSMALVLFQPSSDQHTDRPLPKNEELPKNPVVLFTEGAVKQVFHNRDIHGLSGKWRLRVEVIELPGGKGRHLVDLDTGPTSPEYFEYDYQGIRVVVARSQITRLQGSSVGYRVMAGGKEGFFVLNPNLPDSRD